MKKLVLGALLLALGTACPKVERRVYTFDLKTQTGTLYFENIVTDAPESADSDFMDIVNKVIEGTKLEEDNPGWRVSEKTLYDNDGRLDGKVLFAFDDAAKAGVYKHDKKSPYIWCASRDEEESIVATNGIRLEPTLPGCVAWDRKATQLSVTVKTATLMGNEKPLTDSFTRWSKGEKLDTTPSGGGLFGDAGNPFGSGGDDAAEAFGEAFAGSLAAGMADGMAGDADLTLGPPKTDNGTDGSKFFGTMESAIVKLCAATSAAEKKAFQEVLVISVQPDGSFTTSVDASDAPDTERHQCYQGAFEKTEFPTKDAAWTIRYPVGVAGVGE